MISQRHVLELKGLVRYAFKISTEVMTLRSILRLDNISPSARIMSGGPEFYVGLEKVLLLITRLVKRNANSSILASLTQVCYDGTPHEPADFNNSGSLVSIGAKLLLVSAIGPLLRQNAYALTFFHTTAHVSHQFLSLFIAYLTCRVAISIAHSKYVLLLHLRLT